MQEEPDGPPPKTVSITQRLSVRYKAERDGMTKTQLDEFAARIVAEAAALEDPVTPRSPTKGEKLAAMRKVVNKVEPIVSLSFSSPLPIN